MNFDYDPETGLVVVTVTRLHKIIGPTLDKVLDREQVEGVRVDRNGRPIYVIDAATDHDTGLDSLTIEEEEEGEN